MLDSKFVILGAAFSLIGTSTYAYLTLKGHTKPNRVTWLLWAIAPMIAFAAEIGEGVGLQALMTFMVGFGPALVLVASLINKKAYWKITKFDLVCGGLSVLALFLWGVTRTGNVAIALSIMSDGLAAVPTTIKAYQHPETENTTFIFGSISAGITLLTIKMWTFAQYGFPVYILTVTLILFVLVRFPRLRPAKVAS